MKLPRCLIFWGAGPGAVHADSMASRVLVRGEPINAPVGRADDFAWPPGSGSMAPAIGAAPPAGVSAAAQSAFVQPETLAKKPADTQITQPPKTTTLKQHSSTTTNNAPRPPAPVRGSSNPFGWLR